jgi:hypothetical protein
VRQERTLTLTISVPHTAETHERNRHLLAIFDEALRQLSLPATLVRMQ